MVYAIYAIIGIGLGLSATSIINRNSSKVQNAKDVLEAKKEWIRMLSEQKKQNNSKRLLRR